MPAPFTAFLITTSAVLGVQASLLADEVLKDSNMKLPQYHLQVTQSSCSESNTCNLTCSAVVGHDATFAWYINGEHQATDGPGGSVGKHTIQHFGHIQLNNDLSFVYSTLVILEKADVTSGIFHVECRVMLLDENWSTVRTVKLKGDVVRHAERIHAPLGSECLNRSKCAGRHVTCQGDVYRNECRCNGSQFVELEELQACLRSKNHGQRCLFDEQCRSSTQKCDDQVHECVCSESYHLRGNSCSLQSKLHGICDQYRLCPTGSWCVDNICTCGAQYYEWNGECIMGFLAEKRGRLAIIGLLAGSSLMFLLVLFVMGYYFHTHSYNPSSMFDRAGSTWEPGTTTLMRHKSISKDRVKNAAAAATSVTPLEQTVLPPR